VLTPNTHAVVLEAAQSTVIVLHGYLDQTGSHTVTIGHFPQQGYFVAPLVRSAK